ncbi:MAG: mitochondrial fission ELM1 family protein [Alphaproteobacteria bacterium]
METGALKIWVLTDGRAGNEAQALGLAEAIARRRPARITVRRVAPKAWTARLPARMWHALGAREGGWPFTAYNARVRRIKPPWPDLVIGAGRRIAPLVAALRTVHGVRTAQILDPRMPLTGFDLVAVPEHDRVTGPNVVATVGAIGRLTPDTVAAAAEPWRDRLAALPHPRLAVLLGGPSAAARFGGGAAGRLLEALKGLAEQGHGLMVTPSRRTPEGLVARLADLLGERAMVWDRTGANPYPGILGLADAVLVTQDSVNMASEAASTGKPVHVFALNRVSAKLRAFHATLEARGAARRFDGGIETWDYPPLAEADRVAAEIDARLLADVEFPGALG